MGGLRVLGLVLALVVVPGGVAMSADCAALTKRAKIAECIGDDFQRADATLNSVYKRLMHGLGKTGQTGLRDAERAWIAFRDKHCAFVGGASAGGGRGRIAELEDEVRRLREELDALRSEFATFRQQFD